MNSVTQHLRNHRIMYLLCTLFAVLALMMMRLGNVNADNEGIDLIALSNQKIDEIDHKMHEYSKAYNDAQVIIDEATKIQTEAMSGNNALRAEKAKIEAEKIAIIAGQLK